MNVYMEIERERAARQARRQEVRELEEKMNRVMRPITFVSELVIWAVLSYVALLAMALWATM